jgi:OmcA/MtrC family decaheme c-type cytochrome
VAGAGLSVEILGAAVSEGLIEVTFRITDDAGNPVTPVLPGTQNPQQARVRFTSAHIEEFSGGGDLGTTFLRYVNDVNRTRPGYDGRGTLGPLDASDGLYLFRFSVPLAEAYDPSETYTIGLQANRSFGGESFAVNEVFDFVPAGGEPILWSDTATAQCNNCHNPLVAHGSRFEVRLCKTCHTAEAVDELGRSIDLRVMAHKIHAGVDLPSVADGPPGSEYAIYSSFADEDEVFARKNEDGSVTGVVFPRTLNNCTACHANAPTAEFYRTKPAAAVCASCHDDVNPGLEPTDAGPPGTNHFQVRGFPDGQCGVCHEAEQQREFDVTVPGAHVVPARSTQLGGVNFEFVGIEDHQAGETPTIQFRISENDGTPITDLSPFNRVAFTIAGPTSDYDQVLTPVAAGGGATGMLVGPDSEGIFAYTLAAPLPADAVGTWAIGAEARRMVNLETTPEVSPKSVQEAAVNPVVTFTVDDSMAEMRRVVVEDQRCQSCHGEFSVDFSIHGNLRNQAEYCILCHNPNASDFGRRRNDPAAVAEASEVATIDFKVLIHKIHRGEELEQQPYLVYGFGAPPANFTAHDFGRVLFPGNLADCQTCHAPSTYLLPPFPGTALPTQVAHIDPETQGLIVDGHVGPISAVCTSCHDSDAAATHVETQTGGDGAEACAVCHAEGRIAPVSASHAEN